MTSKERLAICSGCPKYSTLKTCRECGCIMPLKVLIPSAECPLGKWTAQQEIVEEPVPYTVTEETDTHVKVEFEDKSWALVHKEKLSPEDLHQKIQQYGPK